MKIWLIVTGSKHWNAYYVAHFLQAEMPPTGPRRSSELKIEIEGLPEGKSHVNVMCFDLGQHSSSYFPVGSFSSTYSMVIFRK